MVKINRTFLDSGLAQLEERVKLQGESARAEREVFKNISEAIMARERAKISFSEKIASSLAIFIVLIGLALFFYITAGPFASTWSAIFNDGEQGAYEPDGEDATDVATPEEAEIALPTTPGPTLFPPEAPPPMRSVTYFVSRQASHINPIFDSVTVGHRFSSSSDSQWSNAYCYLDFNSGMDIVTLNLSAANSFDYNLEGIERFPYREDQRFSRQDFISAQGLCDYQVSGFWDN